VAAPGVGPAGPVAVAGRPADGRAARPRHAAPADRGRLPPGRIPPGRALAALLAREDDPPPAFLPGRERRDRHAGRGRPRIGPVEGTRPAGAGDGPEQAAPGPARRHGPLLS